MDGDDCSSCDDSSFKDWVGDGPCSSCPSFSSSTSNGTSCECEGYSLILIVIVFQVMILMFKMVVLSVRLDSSRIPPQESRNVFLVISSSQIPPPMDQHQPPVHLVDVNLTSNISHWMDHLVWIVLSSQISLNLDLVIVLKDQHSINLLHLVFVIQAMSSHLQGAINVRGIPSNQRREMIFVLLVMIS